MNQKANSKRGHAVVSKRGCGPVRQVPRVLGSRTSCSAVVDRIWIVRGAIPEVTAMPMLPLLTPGVEPTDVQSRDSVEQRTKETCLFSAAVGRHHQPKRKRKAVANVEIFRSQCNSAAFGVKRSSGVRQWLPAAAELVMLDVPQGVWAKESQRKPTQYPSVSPLNSMVMKHSLTNESGYVLTTDALLNWMQLSCPWAYTDKDLDLTRFNFFSPPLRGVGHLLQCRERSTSYQRDDGVQHLILGNDEHVDGRVKDVSKSVCYFSTHFLKETQITISTTANVCDSPRRKLNSRKVALLSGQHRHHLCKENED